MSSAGRHLRSVRTPDAPQTGTERAIAVRFTSTAGLIGQQFVQEPFEYISRAERHQWRAEQMQTDLERGR